MPEYDEAVLQRIARMECDFDAACRMMERQECGTDSALAGCIGRLSAYLSSGAWLADYVRDEQGELPADLKRGVLAQDALYDLLTEVNRRFSTTEYAQKTDRKSDGGSSAI